MCNIWIIKSNGLDYYCPKSLHKKGPSRLSLLIVLPTSLNPMTTISPTAAVGLSFTLTYGLGKVAVTNSLILQMFV